ncbi:hypothetical protein [Methylomicrobium lacus]|uniref:hypothetical protein n=1 Tax=Methylomicrobium lacus TaxID=136992 RepID=UPI0035A94E80
MNIDKTSRVLSGNRRITRVFFLCVFLAGVFSNSNAIAGTQQKEALTIELTMKRVVTDVKGNEILEEAPRIKPGDLVEYTAVYRNRSKQTISGLKGSLPVPLGLEYVKRSAQPSSVLATTDGANYAAEPLLRTIKDKAGRDQRVEVPYSDYRNLRWEIGDLGAGKKSVVSARMRVIALPKSPEELVVKPATPVTIK